MKDIFFHGSIHYGAAGENLAGDPWLYGQTFQSGRIEHRHAGYV